MRNSLFSPQIEALNRLKTERERRTEGEHMEGADRKRRLAMGRIEEAQRNHEACKAPLTPPRANCVNPP